MDKFTKVLNLLWYGAKIILHLTNKKEKLEKMEDIEKKFEK
ncbi:MAG: hypothetical protein ACRC5S_10555 [Cetobacterium sp.]